jgi:ribonuclease ZC3H12
LLQEITVFVPAWRKESSKPDSPTTAQHILGELEKERWVWV